MKRFHRVCAIKQQDKGVDDENAEDVDATQMCAPA